MIGRAEGEVLKDWRERKGLTQKGLASMAGLHLSSIGAYERGERRPDDRAIARICTRRSERSLFTLPLGWN